MRRRRRADLPPSDPPPIRRAAVLPSELSSVRNMVPPTPTQPAAAANGPRSAARRGNNFVRPGVAAGTNVLPPPPAASSSRPGPPTARRPDCIQPRRSVVSSTTTDASQPITPNSDLIMPRGPPAIICLLPPDPLEGMPSSTGLYGDDWCSHRRVLSANQVVMLMDRERGAHPRGRRNYTHYTDFHSTVPLKRAAVVPEHENRDHWISWTPDGTRLITFGPGFRSIRIYRYTGVQGAFSVCPDNIFKSILRLEKEILLPRTDSYLRTEAIHFTDDGKHFVVVASCQVLDQNVSMQSAYRNNETMPITTQPLENYYFYSIDVEKGAIAGEYSLLASLISVVFGISMSGRNLLVFSNHHQIMHMFQVHSQTGALLHLRDIGPSVHEDEDLVLFGSHRDAFLKTKFMSGFKQRLTTFLYKRALKQGRVVEFLRSTDYRANMMLDRTFLFEKFYVFARLLPRNIGRDSSLLPCFFVVMDWRTAEIVEVFEEFDERFFKFFEESCQSLLFPYAGPTWPGASHYQSLASLGVKRAKNRGDVTHNLNYSIRRLLNQLPYASHQQFKISMQSPYLDDRLFQMDHRFHNAIFCGKIRTDVSEREIKVMSVRNGRCAFRMPLSRTGSGPPAGRQLLMLFHPTDPLCVAVERARQNTTAFVYLP